MPVVPKPDDKTFAPVPQGNHVAVCYRVIDLGTQQIEWKGETKRQHKLLISWEIPDEKMDDGRPFTIGQKFTWSMSDKANLRKVLESWRGKGFTEDDFGPNGFDIKNVIGAGCMVNVVHEKKGDKTYSNIASVAKLPKGMAAPAPTNPRSYVWLSREEFVQKCFDDLSDGLKSTIQTSPEYKSLSEPEHIHDNGSHGGDPREEPPFDDVVPF